MSRKDAVKQKVVSFQEDGQNAKSNLPHSHQTAKCFPFIKGFKKHASGSGMDQPEGSSMSSNDELSDKGNSIVIAIVVETP